MPSESTFLGADAPRLRARRKANRRRPPAEIYLPGAAALAVVAACFLGPTLGHLPSPVAGQIASADLGVWSPHHLLGTDPVGNDELSRVLAGGRVSIEVALASNVIGLLIGGVLGMAAGSSRGLARLTAATAVDLLLAFPALILTIVVAASLGPGEPNVIFALSLVSVPVYGRLARAHSLRIRSEDFISLAWLSGVSAGRVIVTHILPNLASHLGRFFALGLSGAIVFEASLSFLGLGVRSPAPSWGNVIAQGQEYLTSSPRLVLVPTTLMVVLLLSVNLLSDAIQQGLGGRD